MADYLVRHVTKDGKARWYIRLHRKHIPSRLLKAGAGEQQIVGEAWPTREQAILERNKIMEEARQQRAYPEQYAKSQQKQETFAQTVARWRAAGSVNIKGRKNRDTTGEARYEAFWLKELGSMLTTDIEARHIQAAMILWKHAGRFGERSDATVNRLLNWLKKVLAVEEHHGYLPKNPCRVLANIKEDKPRKAIYTEEQVQAFQRELGEHAPKVRVALLTGFRFSEQFGMKKAWMLDQVHHGTRRTVVLFPTTKAGEPQMRPICEEAAAILRAEGAKRPFSPYIWPSPRDDKRPFPHTTWYKIFNRAAERAGIALDRKAGLTWHTFRKTWTTRGLANQVPSVGIKELGGWKTLQMVEHYAGLTTEHLSQMAEQATKVG